MIHSLNKALVSLAVVSGLCSVDFVWAGACDYREIHEGTPAHVIDGHDLRWRYHDMVEMLKWGGFVQNPDSQNIAYVSISEKERFLSVINPFRLIAEAVMTYNYGMGWNNIAVNHYRRKVEVVSLQGEPIAKYRHATLSYTSGGHRNDMISEKNKFKIEFKNCQ